MTSPLLFSRSEVARCLEWDACIAAVEEAFRQHALGVVPPPTVCGVHGAKGGFHIKAGLFGPDAEYFVAKLNANFSGNPGLGLPTIQGVVALCDGRNGTLLALMDSIEITAIRTGAATAVAAKQLARPDSQVATICGCGIQGRAQLRALSRVTGLRRVFLWDIDRVSSERMRAELAPEFEFPLEVVEAPGPAVGLSDICVTCTSARIPFLRAGMVRAGTFIAAVGADAEHKQELAPDLLADALVVADVLTQSATMGDLHHALEAGVMTLSDVHAELGEIVAGLKPGRTDPDQITIFDSTGMALQDAAAAVLVYRRRCSEKEPGTRFNFGA